MKIIAIGGGGCTHGTFPELDRLCIDQVMNAAPRVGFIGTASADDPEKLDRFKAGFRPISAQQIHLPATMTAGDLQHALETIDLVYVGGGHTEKMINRWRDQNWDQVLFKACQSGVVLAGTSAGAVCWFDQFLFHSGEGPMRPLKGLGLIDLGACPHYSSEPERKPSLHAAVNAETMPTTLAIDDGVGVVFVHGIPRVVARAVSDANAYLVSRNGTGGLEEVPLVPFKSP